MDISVSSFCVRITKGQSMIKKIIIGIVGVLACTLGVGAIYIGIKLNQINTEKIDEDKLSVNEGVPEDLGSGYKTFAIFGGDSRSGELEQGVRSDTIIIVSLNNETKEIKMASVYRDTLLDIGDGSLQKCNSAYSFGGAQQALSMLNRNLDLNITDYITVDFKAVADTIDLLGGVEIDVKEEELPALNQYVKETAQVAGKEAHEVSASGLQNLNGVQATTYARIRSTAGGDFVRTERQRMVIEKMVDKVKESNLKTLNDIIDHTLPNIKTSFTAGEILNYAKFFTQYKLGETTGFPIEKTPDRIAGKGSVVIPVTLQTNVKALHEFLYGTIDYQVSASVIGISDAIEDEVGTREAESDHTIYNRMYEDTDDDVQQERYTPPVNQGSSNSGQSSGGSSNGSTNNGNSSNGGSTSQKPDKDKPDQNDGNNDTGKDKPDDSNNNTKPPVVKPPVEKPGDNSGGNDDSSSGENQEGNDQNNNPEPVAPDTTSGISQ